MHKLYHIYIHIYVYVFIYDYNIFSPSDWTFVPCFDTKPQKGKKKKTTINVMILII